MASREVLGWQQFGEATRELAQMIADDGYQPEIILIPLVDDEYVVTELLRA
jgi:hypothetical protein